jgi:hypothetical protein
VRSRGETKKRICNLNSVPWSSSFGRFVYSRIRRAEKAANTRGSHSFSTSFSTLHQIVRHLCFESNLYSPVVKFRDRLLSKSEGFLVESLHIAMTCASATGTFDVVDDGRTFQSAHQRYDPDWSRRSDNS